MKRLCQIFKSPRREEMYLYVDKAKGLDEVPAALLASFGEPGLVMTIVLDSGRKLARADVTEVLARIDGEGFYLQMPPTPAELLARERADG
ncbi:MAG: YcgL domain-containing protein [Parahaliea sp.]